MRVGAFGASHASFMGACGAHIISENISLFFIIVTPFGNADLLRREVFFFLSFSFFLSFFPLSFSFLQTALSLHACGGPTPKNCRFFPSPMSDSLEFNRNIPDEDYWSFIGAVLL